MGRTNIEIDDGLVTEAMRRYGLRSKRAAVDFALRRLVARAIHHIRRLEAQQPRHLDIDPRIGDAFLPHALLGDRLAEGGARHQPLDHRVERFLGEDSGTMGKVLDHLQECLAGHFDVEHSTFQLEARTHLDHERTAHG